MDFIDALIKKLEEAKEELSKNMNCAPGAMLEKDAANPALAPKQVKVKELQGKIDSGTYKPNPKAIADKMLKEELTCSENGQWNIVEKSVNPGITSKHMFTMDHIKAAADHKDHDAAKKMAHSAIDASNARPENKMKAKSMVDSSKSPSHLAQGMTKFHMAHDAKIRTRLNGNKD